MTQNGPDNNCVVVSRDVIMSHIILVPVADPNAPKPEGSTITPSVGEQLIVSERLFPYHGVCVYKSTAIAWCVSHHSCVMAVIERLLLLSGAVGSAAERGGGGAALRLGNVQGDGCHRARPQRQTQHITHIR